MKHRVSRYLAMMVALCLLTSAALAEGLTAEPLPALDGEVYSGAIDAFRQEEAVFELEGGEPETPAETREVSATDPGDFVIEDGVVKEYLGPLNVDELVFPEGVKKISGDLFAEYGTVYNPSAIKFKSVTIPESVESIGVRCIADIDYPLFYNWPYLERIDVASGNRHYTSQDGVLYSKDKTWLICCPRGLTSLNIPEGVIYIDMHACSSCESLTSVTIPGSLKNIEQRAFFNCTSLEKLTILESEVLLGIQRQAFDNCDSLKSVTFPERVSYIGELAFSGCESLTDVTVLGVATGIADNSFYTWNDPQYVDRITFHIVSGAINTIYKLREKGFKVDVIESSEPTAAPTTAPTTVPTTAPTTAPTAAPTYVSWKDVGLMSVRFSDYRTKSVTLDYTGKAYEPSVRVETVDDILLTQNVDYTVTYKNNKNVGTATVTVKGIGDYFGSQELTFTICPRGTTIAKLTAGKAQLTVAWKKQTKQVTGYQLQYDTKKSFKGGKTVTVKGAKTAKKVITKLKSKKTYYVRIRTYKTVKGKKYYSTWSKAKKAKTK